MSGPIDALPLSAYQRAALTRAAETGEPAVRLVCRLGRVPRDAALAAWQALVARHDVLRTTTDPGGQWLVVHADEPAATVSFAADGDGDLTATIALPAPVLDPAGARSLAEEYTARCRGVSTGDAPASSVRAAAAATAGLVPAHGRAPTAPGGAGDPELRVAAMPAPGLARLGTGVTDAVTAAYLWALGRWTGRAAVAGCLVSAAGAPPGAIGEYRVGRTVAVHRDVPSWRALLDRVRAAAPGEPGPVTGNALRFQPVHRDAGDVAPAELTVDVDLAEPDRPTVRVVSAHGRADVLVAELAAALRHIAEDVSADPRHVDRPTAAGASTGPAPETVLDLLAARVARDGGAPAVVDGATTLTYAEFSARVDALAARLVARGAGTDTLVAVHLDRGAELLVAAWAVLRAGGTLVALDPDYPPGRTAEALRQSRARFLVTRHGLPGGVAYDGEVVPADPGEAPPPARWPAPASAAYALFTSGSTGRPKGVLVPPAGLAGLARWTGGGLGVGPGDRVAQRTPAAFDAAMWELFAPLACGAAAVVVRDGADTAALSAVVRETGVTVLQLVPSLLAAHVEAGTLGHMPSLRLVLCGGEALPRRLAAAFFRQSRADLANVYGPTECTVDATWAPAERLEAASPADGTPAATVPIGHPVPGVTAAVLDELGMPVAPGVTGELMLGGDHLALGYLGRPGPTAERFVPDHTGGAPGGRLYRTGDLVTVDAAGALGYAGRTDAQAKVHGVRTEPGEVQARLADHPDVAAAAVTCRYAAGGAELTAWVVPAGAVPDLGARLREHLRAHLPAAMVPTRFVARASLPRLPNGKTDLPALAREADPAWSDFAGPVGPVERELAYAWARLLGADAVGRDDDLPALGADADRGAIVAAGIRSRWGVRVRPGTLLALATVAAQAHWLTTNGAAP